MAEEKTAVVVVKDLFFETRLAGGLGQLGLHPRFVRSWDDLSAAAAPAVLALVDLAARQVDPIEAIRQVRTERPDLPVLAFGSHKDLDLRQRALAAGATRVVANSTLSTDLPGLVQRLLPTDDGRQTTDDERPTTGRGPWSLIRGPQ